MGWFRRSVDPKVSELSVQVKLLEDRLSAAQALLEAEAKARILLEDRLAALIPADRSP